MVPVMAQSMLLLRVLATMSLNARNLPLAIEGEDARHRPRTVLCRYSEASVIPTGYRDHLCGPAFICSSDASKSPNLSPCTTT
jgi:hypothetical protein